MMGSLTKRNSLCQLYDCAYLKEYPLSLNYKEAAILPGWTVLFRSVNYMETYLFIFNQLFIQWISYL
jgi:hypothetical protein